MNAALAHWTARQRSRLANFSAVRVSGHVSAVNGILLECQIPSAKIGDWQRHERNLPDNWTVPHPVVLGQVSLTLKQLRSLRPGDVVLPSLSHFDNNGDGYLLIAGQRWRAGRFWRCLPKVLQAWRFC